MNSSEEWNTKRPSDDTVSTISSLHSSPTVSPQGSPRKGLPETPKLCKNSFIRYRLNSRLLSFFPVGGVAKSQNSNQLNLSGSSSSLTSDASTKAGTISLRSYGIGGALLHKRIQMITRQHSRERSRVLEEEEDGEKGSKVEKKMQDNRGRSRQQSCRSKEVDLKPPSSTPGKKDAMTLTGCTPSQPGLGPMTPPPPLSQRQKTSESPLRTRLMSPFRILRERSRSKEKPKMAQPCLHAGEIKAEAPPSSKQDKQEEKRARRSVSPNPFLWLCRVGHVRSKNSLTDENISTTRQQRGGSHISNPNPETPTQAAVGVGAPVAASAN